LLRCLIDNVVMRRAARDMAEVRIVWRGGEITEMAVALPVNAVTALPRYAEMETRVLQLARAGADYAEIARQLTAEGHRSPSRTEVLAARSKESVCGIASRCPQSEPVRQRYWAGSAFRKSPPTSASRPTG
jgi:hypothetical protein